MPRLRLEGERPALRAVRRLDAWAYVVDVPVKPGELDRHGKPRTRRQQVKGGFESKADAAKAMRAVQSKADAGRWKPTSELTLGQWLERWLPAVRGQVRPSTYASYAGAARAVTERIGHVRLVALAKSDVKALYAGLAESGHRRTGGRLARETVANIHIALRRSLGDAVEEELLDRNPAAGAFRLAPEPRPMNVWTPAELATFLRAVRGDRLAALYRVAATRGLRRGEILALRWRDADLDAATLTITQQLALAADGRFAFGDLKSSGGRRTVSLDAGTVAELRAHRAAQNREKLAWGAAYTDLDLLFCRQNGGPLAGDRVTAAFRRLAQAAGLPPIRFHDLRHGAATIALQAGIGVKVVQEMLGHASPAITLQVYAHVLPGMGADAASRIAAVIDAAG